MARGNRIVVTPYPKGHRVEGYVGAGLSFKPGMCVQIDASVALKSGRNTYKYQTPGADGGRPQGQLAIVVEDGRQGRTTADAYAAGERFFAYVPAEGEELNILLADVAGTGDLHTAGELEIIQNGTGKFIASTGTPVAAPFQLLETIPAPTADTLAWAVFSGY